MVNPKVALEKINNSIEWEDIMSLLSGVGKELLDLDEKNLAKFLWGTSFDYVQAALVGVARKKFYSDVRKLKDKGKLPKDFLKDDLTRKTFVDITRIIDAENPSVDKIDAMKALLVAVANTEDKERYEISTHLDTLRQLDSLEFQMIMSSYRLSKRVQEDQKMPSTKAGWRRSIMGEAGWGENMIYEVERRENHLEELRLIDSSPTNGLPSTPKFRLTGLGVKIGDIVTRKI